MNETIYQLADSGGSVRIVVQKKPDGDYNICISNGKDRPLICQGARETVWNEFESRLPQYLNELKTAAIEAKLNAAEEIPTQDTKTVSGIAAAATEELEQDELDFGF